MPLHTLRKPQVAVARSLRLLGSASHAVLGAAAGLGRALPIAHPAFYGVEVQHDLAYRATGRRAHLLDVYRPRGANPICPAPAVLYLHGGGFGILSKDSYWPLALIFARRGYTVFNISYRLAPAAPFPAAVEDACAAYAWIVRNARDLGGDPDRLVLAGDSAGGSGAALQRIAQRSAAN